MQNLKLIDVIGIVSSYLIIWEKRRNCGNTIAEIQQKLEREIFYFRQWYYCNSFCPFCCPGGCSKCEYAQGKLNDVGKFFFGNDIAENGKKKCYEIYERVKKKLSRPQYFYNIFTINHTWLVIIS